MKKIVFARYLSLVLLIVPNRAAAFNFGFVRVPDWMDPIFVFLLLVMVPTWVAVKLTKPHNVPFNELYRTKMDRLPTIYFRMLQLFVGILLVLLFLGMGLRRMAEAGAG